MAIAQSNMGNKPVILLMRIHGFQPNRFRDYFREPTLEEMRVQAYDSIAYGAKGVIFFIFAKSVSGRLPFELITAQYDIRDSRKQFEKIKLLTSDLETHKRIFLSPFSGSVTVSSSNSDIRCKPWDVNENGEMVKYVICVNVAEETSPYFDYASGERNDYIKAHFLDNADYQAPSTKVLRPFECNDDVDNDGDGLIDTDDSDCTTAYDDLEGILGQRGEKTIILQADKVYIAQVDNGITLNNDVVTHFYLDFSNVPVVGASFDYAIFSDGKYGYSNPNSNEYDNHFDLNRDIAPDTKIISGTEFVSSPGIKIFELPQPVTIQRTRYYYFVMKSSTPISVMGKDVRTGPRSLANNVGFMDLQDQAPVLRKGKNIQATLTISNTPSNYCAQKTIDPGTQFGILSNGQISETFEPYAVHIYKFSSSITGQSSCS